MTLPVSDPVQGAYVVASICTGLVLGGLSVIFKDTTECLGCLLGGFCFSMWILTLTDGGLIPATGPKVGFIIALSFAAFATYFSRWTRSYGLIVCISFSGATSAVLGIDCFSRAGLKEFWAYVWDLNGDLFPLGTETYPLTRGMRVELAATVIIAVTGIVSQLKLWRIVRERRAMRAAERAEGDRNLREEEEHVGRRVEEANDRERDEWERAYGDGSRPRSAARTSGDSGVGDMDSEKRLRDADAVAVTEIRDGGYTSEEQIEMTDIPAREDSAPSPPPPPPAKPPVAEGVISHDPSDGTIMVRVVRDGETAQVPGGDGHTDAAATPDSREWTGESPSSGQVTPDPRRSILGTTATPVPAVVPLPFTVTTPVPDEEEDRSSVATFAPEDEVTPAATRNRPDSMAQRLSAGSSKLFRSFSQRSRGTAGSVGVEHGESREELTASRLSRRDDNDSVAANLDDMSVDGSNIGTVRDEGAQSPSPSIEINADLTKEGEKPEPEIDGEKRAQEAPNSPDPESVAARESTTTETAPTGTLDGLGRGVAPTTGTTTPDTSTILDGRGKADGAIDARMATRDPTTGENSSSKGPEEKSHKTKSYTSSESRAASLTKDNLPRSLSRVAMSFRTNEWAKHLSFAETPEPDSLKLNEYRPESPSPPRTGENPVPLDVDELQKTADNASPPPAVPRSASAMANLGQPRGISPSVSRASLQPTVGPEPYRSASVNASRRVSPLLPAPIAEEHDHELHAAPMPASGNENVDPSPVSRSPSPPEYSIPAANRPNSRAPTPGVVSYSSPQTLIGKREMFLRSKSQASFYLPAAEPPAMSTIMSRSSSETGSIYNQPAASRGPSASHVALDAPDADDIPLSQRREMMRRSSIGNGYDQYNSYNYNNYNNNNNYNNTGGTTPPNNHSSMSLAALRPMSSMSGAMASAESVPFNSHQPQRRSNLPSEATRQAQLASFRTSVAAELRAGTPVAGGPAGSLAAAGMTTTSLGGGGGRGRTSSMGSYGLDAEARRNVDAQRSFLLSQKEAEVQKRDMERLEKERGDREFEERMRRGDLMEAHREAMRKLQGGVKG